MDCRRIFPFLRNPVCHRIPRRRSVSVACDGVYAAMERAFFKSDALGPFSVRSTSDDKIDFRELGYEFRLDPFTMRLCGEKFPETADGGESKDLWMQTRSSSV